MRKITILLFILPFVIGCNSNHTNNDIFQYKDSFVGDNSAVISIVNQIQAAEHFNGIELKTKEEPFGIILKYDLFDKETVINNATYLFTLIQNVNWITFNSKLDDYSISREELEACYGRDLNEIDNEDELRELIQETIEIENKVNQFLN
ncbi:MAG TPA: DUF4825 domain-containing protein [Metabacillus sp.]|nr:DUF4825 domain-containing protein [Metabacillus sp.]